MNSTNNTYLISSKHKAAFLRAMTEVFSDAVRSTPYRAPYIFRGGEVDIDNALPLFPFHLLFYPRLKDGSFFRAETFEPRFVKLDEFFQALLNHPKFVKAQIPVAEFRYNCESSRVEDFKIWENGIVSEGINENDNHGTREINSQLRRYFELALTDIRRFFDRIASNHSFSPLQQLHLVKEFGPEREGPAWTRRWKDRQKKAKLPSYQSSCNLFVGWQPELNWTKPLLFLPPREISPETYWAIRQQVAASRALPITDKDFELI